MTDKVELIRNEIERLREFRQKIFITEDEDVAWEAGKTFALTSIEILLDSMQEEPRFKIGDTISKIHNSDINKFGNFRIDDIRYGSYWYKDSKICKVSEQDEWELVEEPKEFKPVRKKQPEGVLKELLDNMDEKELEDTRKEMMDESIYTNENLPETIYCEDDGLGNIVKAHNIRWPNDEAKNIEYIRKYAFIRKAILYLSKHDNYIAFNDIFINDFEEYMKGE